MDLDKNNFIERFTLDVDSYMVDKLKRIASAKDKPDVKLNIRWNIQNLYMKYNR